jgi:hypothetical protein
LDCTCLHAWPELRTLVEHAPVQPLRRIDVAVERERVDRLRRGRKS